MTFIRSYIEGYSYDLNEKFSEILSSSVGAYYIECFETGKNLSCMYGE